MRKLHVVALAVLAFFTVPSVLSAQNLAEAAAKEKERRKAVKGAKTFNDDDLGRTGYGSTSTPDTGAPATEAATSGEGETAQGERREKSEEEIRAEASAAWRKKLERAQENVRILQEQMDRIQMDLNDSSGGFYGARRTRMLDLLEETKTKLADAQKEVTDIEDEGRRNRYR